VLKGGPRKTRWTRRIFGFKSGECASAGEGLGVNMGGRGEGIRLSKLTTEKKRKQTNFPGDHRRLQIQPGQKSVAPSEGLGPQQQWRKWETLKKALVARTWGKVTKKSAITRSNGRGKPALWIGGGWEGGKLGTTARIATR